MLTNAEDGRAVHFPANPAKFEFDREVSAVFGDIAVRSIPNFLQAHDAHASMLRPWLHYPGASVMDIGASRGHFVAALKRQYGDEVARGDIEISAIDSSPEMCAHLKTDHPEVNARCLDITSNSFLTDTSTYDVVCMHYVLQFIPAHLQTAVLHRVFRMVRAGGVLIFGHKAEHTGESGNLAHEEYIKFRIKNGYTREEIEAKTLALKGSMFPMSHGKLMATVKMHFGDVSETFRYMMFNAFFAIKNDR